MGEEVVGRSGRRYKIQRTLQDKGVLRGRVYLASDGESRVVLKDIPQDWAYRNQVYDMAKDCAHIRLPIDTVVNRRILVFEYVEEHLLNVAQRNLSLNQMKCILKGTLEGIACLHRLRIVHNDIKPNTILVQLQKSSVGTEVGKVLITDLEDAVHIEQNQMLKGAALGNYMWRSPEVHAEGPMEMPSDMFAFGIVCIYVLTTHVIFALKDPDMPEVDKVASVYLRHLTHFADECGTRGFLDYLGAEHPMLDVFEAVEEAFKDMPKKPFTEMLGSDVDDDFKDLVGSVTKLDPRRRITAQEALAHKWFRDA